MQSSLESETPPEILQADLSPLVLELAKWGCSDPSGRHWLSQPPETAWKSAVELLCLLGALDGQGRITQQGEAMAALPVHPRIAALLLFGNTRQCTNAAALLAAFLEQRDFYPSGESADLSLRLDYLCRSDAGSYRSAIARIKDEAAHLQKRVAGRADSTPLIYSSLLDMAPALVAQAFPDRIGMQVEPGVYQLSGGGRVLLEASDSLAVSSFIIAAHCGGNPDRQKLFLGIPIEKKEVEELFSDRIVEEIHGRWDKQKCRLFSETRRRLGALTLSKRPNPRPGREDALHILHKALLKEGKSILPWDVESLRLYDRMCFAAAQASRAGKDWPDLSEKGLADSAGEWIVPYLQEGKLKSSLSGPLKSLLDWSQQQFLEKVAPDFYQTALGNRRKIHYGETDPYLPLPIQELYGCDVSPMLGDQPLVLHLQNPAGRTVQITADLAGFWQNGWTSVRGELKGRYPKHFWPEDAAHASPSLKTGKNRPVS